MSVATTVTCSSSTRSSSFLVPISPSQGEGVAASLWLLYVHSLGFWCAAQVALLKQIHHLKRKTESDDKRNSRNRCGWPNSLCHTSHLAVVVIRWVLLSLQSGLQDLIEDLDNVRPVARGNEEEGQVPLGSKIERFRGDLGKSCRKKAERCGVVSSPMPSVLRGDEKKTMASGILRLTL